MMLKFSILVVCLLVANLCHEVQGQGNFKKRVREELKNQKARIDRLESAVFGAGGATVTMKIENSLVPESRQYNVSVPAGNTVFQMMVAATMQFSDFTFRDTYYPSLASHFIDSINGLAGSTADKTFWRFEDGNGAAFDRGVDLINVYNGDVIVFRFTSWATPATEHP
ncbi:Hypp3194 [Branchiostoma lanceolatum]|uniref:Hypp3194 protein n=1 Tax=Branchiostoma lanceolatum TaxID=7740 RepID=A0A8K0A0K8_BRALA|nr:Hypp3194 [Branchiostoma lanceolatum]